jgi:hypothetical protein
MERAQCYRSNQATDCRLSWHRHDLTAITAIFEDAIYRRRLGRTTWTIQTQVAAALSGTRQNEMYACPGLYGLSGLTLPIHEARQRRRASGWSATQIARRHPGDGWADSHQRNFATASVQDRLKPALWTAWPLLAVLVLVAVFLDSSRDSQQSEARSNLRPPQP